MVEDDNEGKHEKARAFTCAARPTCFPLQFQVNTMRASRLLSIQMLLQTRGRLSATALAAELEVTPRTILRDIDQLSAAGVPVWSERGSQGGFQLRSDWRTQLTGLTDKEAQALFLAGLPSAATALGLGHASASAQLKMLASLPAALQDDAQRVTARLHVDTTDWFRSADAPQFLQTVAQAVWQQQPINMRYESWSSTTQRRVKPLGLVLKAGVWYLVALPWPKPAERQNATDQTADHKPAKARNAPRTYRLSNILSLVVENGTFQRPKRFDLTQFWQSSTAQFEADIYTATATLRVNVRGAKLLKQFSPAIHQALAATSKADPMNPKWSLTEIPIESVSHATHQLLALGADVEVLAPTELRASLAEAAREMAALYADAQAG